MQEHESSTDSVQQRGDVTKCEARMLPSILVGKEGLTRLITNATNNKMEMKGKERELNGQVLENS